MTRTITFEEIEAHLKAQYGLDVSDLYGKLSQDRYGLWCAKHGFKRHGDIQHQHETYAKYVEAEDGEAQEPPYFNFWHFLLDATEGIAWKQKSGQRWKIVPLPSAAQARERAESRKASQANLIEYAKSLGVDPRRLALPSPGDEAADILTKIEAAFGTDLFVKMTVDC
jgi:hypothetical protein